MVMGGNNNMVIIFKSKHTQNEQISRDQHYLYFWD